MTRSSLCMNEFKKVQEISGAFAAVGIDNLKDNFFLGNICLLKADSH